ncbi:MAG: response regulator transcription factor [Cyanothece sp. SIO1E1]|nr:response regulator transcription factor [Cyanothece sp. SIO1E1]
MSRHILLVEDETRLAKFVELDLSAEGYQVSVAHDGLTGLEIARQTHPDLVILDWMLPRLTGIEVCQHLRSIERDIPIIFVTAMDGVEHRTAGLSAGANDYLIKPFHMEDLLVKIDTHLQKTHSLAW